MTTDEEIEERALKTIPNAPRYVQGAGLLRGAIARLRELGRAFFLVNKHTPLPPDVEEELQLEGDSLTTRFNGECSERELRRLADAARGFDRFVAIGDPPLLDAAKLVAAGLGMPLFLAPSSGACFAASSHYASIYDDYRRFMRAEYVAASPRAIIADVGFLCSAPPRFLAAGMGGALACAGAARGGELPEAFSSSCRETVLSKGRLAALGAREGVPIPALADMFEAILLRSGQALDARGPSLALAVGGALSRVRGRGRLLRGERCAFGLLAQLVLEDADDETLRLLLRLCVAVGLPVSFEELGMEKAAPDALAGAAARAAAMNPPGPRYGEREILDAMKTADALGRLYAPE